MLSLSVDRGPAAVAGPTPSPYSSRPRLEILGVPVGKLVPMNAVGFPGVLVVPVGDCVFCVLRSTPPREIFRAVIGLFSVQVPHLGPLRAGPVERLADELVDEARVFIDGDSPIPLAVNRSSEDPAGFRVVATAIPYTFREGPDLPLCTRLVPRLRRDGQPYFCHIRNTILGGHNV